jgi:hypothetical protein
VAAYDIDEVERAFRHYWQTGAVNENWDGYADNFTEDAHYVEHFFGEMHGREAIRAWIKPTMVEFPEIYTAYEWHVCSPDGRVVVYMQNRRDNPDPKGGPIDFPGVTILQYAGGMKFAYEEDFWSVKGGMATSKQYTAACAKFDPDHPKKRTRGNWGHGPAWTQGAPSYVERTGPK